MNPKSGNKITATRFDIRTLFKLVKCFDIKSLLVCSRFFREENEWVKMVYRLQGIDVNLRYKA